MANYANGELLLTRLTDIVDRDKAIVLPVYILVYMRVIDLQVAYPYGTRAWDSLDLRDVFLWPPSRPAPELLREKKAEPLIGDSKAEVPKIPPDLAQKTDSPIAGDDSFFARRRILQEQQMQFQAGVDIIPEGDDKVQRDTGNEPAPALALTDSPASILHLIKRPYLAAKAMGVSTGDVRYDLNVFSPDTVPIQMNAAVPGGYENKTCTRLSHPLDYFSSMFKFRRGSVNLVATSGSVSKRTANAQPARVWIFNQPACDSTSAVTRFSSGSTNVANIMVGSGMGWGDSLRPMHFNLPYLSNHAALPFPRFLNVYSEYYGVFEISENVNFMYNKDYFGEVAFIPSVTLYGDGPSSLWYSAGDDFLPLLFFGFPAIFYENMNATPVTTS
jgi:hypothetical protein